ncbi:hypothetical protein A3I48_01460 [Candidatus Daviesbacteria bacterium RIFCSPLOWO2_02_FULL_36_7]|uniref:Uncharacterized protein n=1 Tax=Candidatus Daviesbacteria bacterium RIFCSPLOWO2_02_FULL_36_7 TaxID=1797792 RepID=A0A1F5MH42_9BACT|nr:MAG: hypothetical protein A3I48_01460 [Candidatus Daviesbacteria bacterium RIFCSPLOWO2_02_FULL_36_7]
MLGTLVNNNLLVYDESTSKNGYSGSDRTARQSAGKTRLRNYSERLSKPDFQNVRRSDKIN